MEKLKKFGIAFSVCAIIVLYLVLNAKSNEWPVKFGAELNHFFGKGNWKCVSKETKKSIFSKYSDEGSSKYFTNWNIEFTNKNGNKENYVITNHVLKINNKKNWVFSSKRYSAKQALVRELMDIACELAADEVLNDIIKDELDDNIGDCFRVYISYHGGNPKPKFYDKLYKQAWFNVKNISAEKFLDSNLYNFYIDIGIHDYKVKKLTEEEQDILYDSMGNIEKRLLKEYGDTASFEIYFDKERNVEYENGKKID